jgi:FAD-dependent urate hydroxylase
MAMSDVLVIGAGPFGLAISTHLRHRGIEHTIVGRPMNTWRNHMPPGLFLKSEPYGSVIASAKPGYDLATYARLNGFDDYVPRIGPLSLERFLGYADWFTEQLVPDIRDLTVTSVVPGHGGFKVEFAEDSPIFARQIIIATGLMPYMKIPDELSGLPSDLMTHTSAHSRLDQFVGKKVAVIGGGQSALQTAALLHEAGTEVQIIARRQQIKWEGQVPTKIGPIGYVKRPPTYLCEGWACVGYGSPDAFRRLPESLRINKSFSTFGPSGAWWLRDRVEGTVEVLTSHALRSAESHGSGVRLHLDGPKQSIIDADHVMAGTGFRIDMSRLSFLSEDIQAALVTRVNYPVVNRAGESTVPGLYFAGAHTTVSLGPGVRFIAGTHHTAGHLARSVARKVRRLNSRNASAMRKQEPESIAPRPSDATAGQR